MTHFDDGGPMKDERLDAVMREARETYRLPSAAPDFEAMWGRIERDAFEAPVAVPGDAPRAPDAPSGRAPRRAWWIPAVGIAATLVLGIGIGRWSAPAGPEARDVASVPSADSADMRVPGDLPAIVVADPLQRATYEYVARTVALLDSLPATARAASRRGDERFVADATQLLTTTRLLLDSPAATDPRMRDLLEDLELVLAQVARLRTAPRADELTYIADAVSERDVVPRLRTVAASYTGGY